MARILVINPNSSKSVTQSMEVCLVNIVRRTAHDIACIELAQSPLGIESDDHVTEVVPHILDAVLAHEADAFVIACFSDPGIDKIRAATEKPHLWDRRKCLSHGARSRHPVWRDFYGAILHWAAFALSATFEN